MQRGLVLFLAAFVPVAALAAPACSGSNTPPAEAGADASSDRATRRAETSTPDTSVADAGAADTGVADTSVRDTSVADTSVADTSAADTSVADTGVSDTSVSDTGAGDTGTADAGDSGTLLVVNGCAAGSYVDRTAAGATRTIPYDFNVGNVTERCMRIQVGQSVSFSPAPVSPHTLASSGGDTPNPIGGHAAGVVTFANAGVFGFICGNHSFMNGAIHVVP